MGKPKARKVSHCSPSQKLLFTPMVFPVTKSALLKSALRQKTDSGSITALAWPGYPSFFIIQTASSYVPSLYFILSGNMPYLENPRL